MKQLFREPLVHFLLLGAGLFVAFGLVDKRPSGEPGKIVITQGQIEHLAAGYNRVHGRPASPEELEGLIGDYVREEVYYREALALGLDRDDPVIRNRLRLKMEFISDDVAAQAEPTEEQLRSYLQEHPDTFRIEPRFTFSQVYLNPERHRESLAHDAAQLLTQLNQAGDKADVSELGDPFLLEHKFVAPRGQRGRETIRREVRREIGRTAARPMAGASRVGLRRASGVRLGNHGGARPHAGGSPLTPSAASGPTLGVLRRMRSSTKPSSSVIP